MEAFLNGRRVQPNVLTCVAVSFFKVKHTQTGCFIPKNTPKWYPIKKEVMSLYFRRIFDLREDNDVKQIAISNHLHIHPNVYRRYEKGEREVPVWTAIALAEFYNVSVDYLLGISDDPVRRR